MGRKQTRFGTAPGLALAFLGLLPLVTGCSTKKPPDATGPVPNGAKRVWYRLDRVEIPPDSPHRKDTNLNSTPRLFVVVKKNGEPSGESTEQSGWSAVFERAETNQWPVFEGSDARYTVEVWDRHRLSNVMIFNVVVSGDDFRKKMIETAGSFIAADRLASIEFRPVEAPEVLFVVAEGHAG